MRHTRTAIWELRVAQYVIWALSFVLAAQGQTLPSQLGSVRGTTFTTESGQEHTFVPSARVRIQYVETENGVDRMMRGKLVLEF